MRIERYTPSKRDEWDAWARAVAHNHYLINLMEAHK